eukprot:TRINITY_DN17410_c0_g1_i1.p2 TRINITY_DN17410_c0_g1~~TRINITY_DN17410_c0_g1_i1.p2  ORF type:complete len:115 (+),score=27.89 TRINITY_DN17410_c0_g1_i1:120-464(+)
MERYEKKQLLGKGGFAKVYLAVDKLTNKEYAMKVMDISGMEPKKYENEISLFQATSKLSHPNIVKYETSFVDRYKKRCVIIMEYCKGKVTATVRRGFGKSYQAVRKKRLQDSCG